MNVYMPAEAVHMEPRRRFLDWRFLATLTALMLVSFLVWAGFRNYELREAETAQKDALIEQLASRSAEIRTLEQEVTDLNDRLAALHERSREDRKLAAEERRAAAKERRQLLRQQQRMIALLRAANITYTPAPATRGSTVAVSSPRPSSGGTTSTVQTSKPATAGKSGKTPPGNARGLRRR